MNAFLPTSRGRFIFPAPYSTEAYRLTVAADCGGGDCVQQAGYSDWPNLNFNQGSNTLRALVSLYGNGGATLFSVDKTTGTVTNNGPIFPPGDPLYGNRAEGWYWSESNPDWLYAAQNGGTTLQRMNVVTRVQTTIMSTNARTDLWGTGARIRNTHSSADDLVHNAKIIDSGGNNRGCAVYFEATNTYRFFPVTVPMQCAVDKSGRYLIIGFSGSSGGTDVRSIDLTTGAEQILTDPNGAPGHMDRGHGYFIGLDNWHPRPGALRLWNMGQPYNDPGNGRLVYYDSSWNISYGQPTWRNALPESVRPINQQYACETGTAESSPNPQTAREREIFCMMLDGSLRTLIVAPNMTIMETGGGEIPYFRAPKGNVDSTGQYYFWVSNHGTNRMDAFIVRIPYQVLTGGGSGDATPPTVSVTAPVNGTTVTGTATLTATAADNVGVAGVQFRLDGSNLGAEDTSSPYSIAWNSTSVSNGTHTLTAVARDAAGNVTTSGAVTVSVANATQTDTTPPTASVTAPANGSTVSGTVGLAATAADNVGVVGVQFLIDGSAVGTEDTTSPYSFSWNSTAVSNGSHAIAARARDAAGNTTTSAAVSVTVQNQAADTAPPTGALTAPAAGSTVSGTVTVSATASDNIGVAGVQFLLDGANLGSEDTSSPYSIAWNTVGVSNGTHTLSARIRDAAGNTATAAARTVTVDNGAVPTGPIAAYALNESGGTTATDSSPTGNSATLAGATWSAGQFGSALATNGSGLADAPDQDALTPGTVATMSAWIYLTSTPTETVSIVNKWSQSSEDEYLFGLLPDRQLFLAWQTSAGTAYGTPGFNEMTAGGPIALNTWTHVAFVRNGTSLSFYVNGVVVSQSDVMDTLPFRNGSNSLRIGGQQRGGVTRFFPGRIDELRIYRRALTTAEIVADRDTPIIPPAGDSVAPTVSVTGPAPGATVSGTASLTASASDNVGVTGVQFRLNGNNLGAEMASSPYSTTWNTTTVANGTYTLTAIARDAAGNVGTSAGVTVTVSNTVTDTAPPTVSISAPANGAAVAGTVTITAAAADNVGVAGVRFQLDGTNLGAEDTASPYSVNWVTTTATNGSHTIRAIARDAAGNTTTSGTVTVVVSNTSPATGIIASFSFNEGTGGTAADSSPNANPGTLVGAAAWGTGRFGTALAVNGAGYVNAADIPAITPGTSATFEAWVLLTSNPTGDLASIFNKWSQSKNDEYLFAIDRNRRPFFAWRTTAATNAWGTPSFNEALAPTQVQVNVWTHVAVVRNGPTLTFYVNGEVASQITAMDTSPFRDGNNSLRIGGQGRAGFARYFPGRIDEARIYNRALTQAEIQASMNAALVGGF